MTRRSYHSGVIPLQALPICVARISRTADLSPYVKGARYGTLLTFTSVLQILEQWVSWYVILVLKGLI